MAFREGYFVHVTGFRSSSNEPMRLDDDEAAVAHVRAVHPRAPGDAELEVLESVFASLTSPTDGS